MRMVVLARTLLSAASRNAEAIHVDAEQSNDRRPFTDHARSIPLRRGRWIWLSVFWFCRFAGKVPPWRKNASHGNDGRGKFAGNVVPLRQDDVQRVPPRPSGASM